MSYTLGKGIKDLDNESYSLPSKMWIYLNKELQYRRDMEKANNIKKEGRIEEFEKLQKEIEDKYKNLKVQQEQIAKEKAEVESKNIKSKFNR